MSELVQTRAMDGYGTCVLTLGWIFLSNHIDHWNMRELTQTIATSHCRIRALAYGWILVSNVQIEESSFSFCMHKK